MSNPQVYVGTYAKYSNGSIEGAWVSLEGHDKESFYEACAELHSDEDDPEFMFQDYEDFPSDFYSESSLDDDLWAWLELGEDDRELVEAFTDCFGSVSGKSLSELAETARDAYFGSYRSDEEFADDYLETSGLLNEVPESLRGYFDTSKFARDLMLDFCSSNGFYFQNNW